MDARNGVRRAMEELDKAPPISQEAMFYWDAFQALSADRPPAFSGIASIPLSAIINYAAFLEMSHREADVLIRIIRALDLRQCVMIKEKHDKTAK